MADNQNPAVEEHELTAEETNEQRQVRIDKLLALQEAGNDPFQVMTAEQTHHTVDAKAIYTEHEEKLLAGFHLPYEGESLVSENFEKFLEGSNIQILEDEVVEVLPGITLIGRIDESSPNFTEENRNRKSIEELSKDIEPENFIINLDHEPSELEEKSEAGIDLDLGGHTHKGQIFPGTLLIHAFWDNAYGLKTRNGMTSVVTSGVGVWGPAMRVGSKSEIAVIHVTFN